MLRSLVGSEMCIRDSLHPQRSKTPESIDIKLDRGDYVSDLTPQANFDISILKGGCGHPQNGLHHIWRNMFIFACRCTHAGLYCEVTPCASQPCLNGGTCTDLVAGYNCTCPSAYIGDTCATPYCRDNNQCLNGGTCHGAGLCRCPSGYTGIISLTTY